MKRDEFERVVNEAIAELPEEFRRKLEDVIVIVDDRPSGELLDNGSSAW
jgi:predicted Zn-dependent protease with MMP-like domain